MNSFNTSMKTIFTALALALGVATVAVSLPVSAKQPPMQHQQKCACFEVSVVGEGPAILLIPGVASSADVWQSTVDALKNDYQLHIFTLAGFAGVEPIAESSWENGYLLAQQRALLLYIHEQQLAKPIVIGHSLGGYLALALATSSPEQIGAVINVDGLPALGALFAQASQQNSNTESAPTAFEPMTMAKSMTNNESWHQRIVNDMFRSDGMTSGRVMGELMQADLRPQLTKLQVPVLTLGALQNGAPYSTLEQVQDNFEQQFATAPSEYHRFAFAPNSKHFIMADAPDWLNQQVAIFLQKIDEGT